jgi:hypothetical protein
MPEHKPVRGFELFFDISSEFLNCVTVVQITVSDLADVGNSATVVRCMGLAAKLSERGEVEHKKEGHEIDGDQHQRKDGHWIDEMAYRPPNKRLKKPPRLRDGKSSNSA